MQTNTSLKISLVDDDAQMRMMLEDFIKDKYPFAEVTCYKTGEEAVENISTVPDLVLLDYNLDSINEGGMHGIQTLRKLREKFPKIAVIFISGQEKAEVAANTMKHGALDYIIKNQDLFNRFEITLNNLIGQAKINKDSTKKNANIKVLAILAVCLLLAIVIWKSLKN